MKMPTAESATTRRSGCGGYTLVERLSVLVVLSLLAGIVSVSYLNHQRKSRVDAAKAHIGTLGLALDSFMADIGRYPTTEEGMAALVTAPSGAAKWKGPYVKKHAAVPPDSWGNQYYVEFPAFQTKYGLVRDGDWGQGAVSVSDLRGTAIDLRMLSYEF